MGRLGIAGVCLLAAASCRPNAGSNGSKATATTTAAATATPTTTATATANATTTAAATPTTNAPPIPPHGPAGPPRTFKVYVAGESIEAMNRYVGPPFTAAGELDNHGADPNRADEFGWMVPFADHLKHRDGGVTLAWVGSDAWKGIDDADYSGTYPSRAAPKTSAVSGTTIPAWLDWPGKDDLEKKAHCYDVAICARGGNDFPNADDAAYKAQLGKVIRMLAAGSSCRPRPLVLVTTHIPDDRQEGMPVADFVAAQTRRYKTRVDQAVAEVKASDPKLLVRTIDLFSAFRNNWPTRAFPKPAWFVGQNWDFAKIHRDGLHPKRLASIYAGEVAANAVDLAELRALP